LNPAVFAGRANDYGTVEANKYASLVLLNSNPLENITNTKDINSVFLKGYYLSRHSLDSLMRVQETAYYYQN
jgi:imidazolonepropionase-like amidohydrolase